MFGGEVRKRHSKPRGTFAFNPLLRGLGTPPKATGFRGSGAGNAPYAEGIVMAQHGNRPQFPVIRGIDPQQESAIIPINAFISLGTWQIWMTRACYWGAFGLQLTG